MVKKPYKDAKTICIAFTSNNINYFATKCISIYQLINIFFLNKSLGITMQLDILVMLTPQVTTIICNRMKKVLLKKEKKIQKYGGTRPKPIY